MKINADKFVFVHLLFFLLMFLLSCSTRYVDRVKVIEQAFNINNIDSALSHYTDNIVFELDVKIC